MFQLLLKELFLGSIETLRELMKELSESERNNLNKQFTPIIKALYRALWDQVREDVRNRWWKVRKFDLAYLHQFYLANPKDFLEQDWKKELPDFNERDFKPNKLEELIELLNILQVEYPQREFAESSLYLAYDHQFLIPYEVGITKFIQRIRALEIGLGTQRTVESVLKKRIRNLFNYRNFWTTQNWLKNEDNSILWLGRILLDRQVEWRQSVFYKLCEKITNWQDRYCTGFADLLIETYHNNPDWQNDLSTHFGKAMIFDGFTQRQWYLKYPTEMLLAGLTVQQLPNEAFVGGLHSFPVTNNSVTQELCAMLSERRADRMVFIEQAVREMLLPQRPAVLTGWCNLFKMLQLNDQEKQQIKYSFIDFCQSTNSEVVQIGIKGIEQLWQARQLSATEIVPPLSLALNHQVQVAAINAFQLLKRIIVDSDFEFAAIIPNLLDGLSSPHKQLRINIIKWLKQYQQEITSIHFDQLAQVLPLLNMNEQAELGSILPELLSAETRDQSDPSTDQIDLATLITRGEHLANNNSDPTITQWYKYLQSYLTHGDKHSPLEPIKVTLNDALKHDFPRFESAEEMALTFVNLILTQPFTLVSALDFEQYLAGIYQFRTDADNKRIDEILQPVYRDWRESYQHTILNINYTTLMLWRFKGDVPLLARHGRDKLAAVDIQKSLYTFIVINRINSVINQFKRGTGNIPLGIPTNRVGWLDPVVFAERFLNLDKADIDLCELATALYRLPLIPERLSEAWQMLADRVQNHDDSIDNVIEQAICLALGTQEIFQNALEWFSKYFQEKPPSLFLYHQYNLMNNNWNKLSEEFYAQHNQIFLVFCAAIRARFGLSDAREYTIDIPLTKIVCADEIAYRYLSHDRVAQDKQLLEIIKEHFLFNPCPIDFNFMKLIFDGMYIYSGDVNACLPELQPYLNYVRNNGSFWGLQFNSSYFYPPNAQCNFELIIAKLIETSLQYDGNNCQWIVSYLEKDLPKHVDVTPTALSTIVKMLLIKDVDAREKIINILLAWLMVGRCVPVQLAELIADAWRQTTKGAKYLTDSLTSLEVAHHIGKHFTLLVIEQLLIKDVDNIPTKILTMAITKLEELNATIGTVRDKRAIAQLEKLANAKKSTPIRETAKQLLTRVKRDSLPLEVEIVAQLLDQKIKEALVTESAEITESY